MSLEGFAEDPNEEEDEVSYEKICPKCGKGSPTSLEHCWACGEELNAEGDAGRREEPDDGEGYDDEKLPLAPSVDEISRALYCVKKKLRSPEAKKEAPRLDMARKYLELFRDITKVQNSIESSDNWEDLKRVFEESSDKDGGKEIDWRSWSEDYLWKLNLQKEDFEKFKNAVVDDDLLERIEKVIKKGEIEIDNQGILSVLGIDVRRDIID